ncbi:MAG: 5,6-dimethylbenzimidazole synthase [Rhodospirillum sp.]|nr:5,6-dimethylbenzimidazole synthase [Rhodospirillum sp.]MCF8487884.1 5,6-dimethylbenzimidazole synthase [Rhodospirillum sp.]MCF8499206.1 5,6-dimethylbenzimidazole synthase [Rhodospirillum sp.]
MSGTPKPDSHTETPSFDSVFRGELETLFRWRRDVRHFRRDPLPKGMVEHLLAMADLAPSVGNSQPWRFLQVTTEDSRARVVANFEDCNAQALANQDPDRQDLYASLKLEGLRASPVHLAVFCDEGTEQGHGLGQETMPETRRYSVVMAIHTLWLAARAQGVGVGWVSILNPADVARILNTPPDWTFVAYLCVGWPQDYTEVPELERLGWQARRTQMETVAR